MTARPPYCCTGARGPSARRRVRGTRNTSQPGSRARATVSGPVQRCLLPLPPWSTPI